MTEDQFITAVAGLLAGLQVPRSTGVLGMGAGAFDELHRGLHGFGWNTAQSYEEEIRSVLGRQQ